MKRFLKGFVYAFNGIMTCIKEERNFRFHMAAAFHLFTYLPFFDINKAELCILIILCGLVFALEAVNTSVENSIDSTSFVNSHAGAAKDSAAGAVLIAAIVSVICGFVILWQPKAFAAILQLYLENPIAIAAQFIILIFWIWFVFVWNKDSKNSANS